MDLSTPYMGFKLAHPIIPGASPLVDDLDAVRRLEDAGAPAIVMHSLFEEQIVGEEIATRRAIEEPAFSFSEASGYLPRSAEYKLGPDAYLDQVRRLKEALGIPVIASLNGTTLGGWTEYARLIEQAGADGLELNVYYLATDPSTSGTEIESRTLELVRAVRKAVTIPLAVKLSPYYSSFANFASRLTDAGAQALVIFNRLYQPDIDLEQLELVRVNLSSSTELLLRLRWLAILHGRTRAQLAATGGVHTATDALKALMCGADVVQMVSALLMHGPLALQRAVAGVRQWLTEQEYESLAQLRGSMSLRRCPDPAAYERANYTRMLQSWNP